MEILFATTELSPFIKVGGLADVAAALPKALRGLGHSVTIAVPRFGAFEAGGLLVARRLTPLKLDHDGEAVDVTVFDGRLASQVDLVLLDVPGLFDRTGVYGEDGEDGEDYPDNARRFGIFSHAVAELVRQRREAGRPFDVVHLHDWPTALAAWHLAREKATRSGAVVPKTMLTVHNATYQGVFERDKLHDLGVGDANFHVDGIEFFGKANVLKAGVQSADVVTTVSPTYATEMTTADGGAGLDGDFRAKEPPLVGILNGVDYATWNPAIDAALVARYDAEGHDAKITCKAAFVREHGLPTDPSLPLIGFVGRFVAEKGIDLLAQGLVRLMKGTDASFVICGDGDPRLRTRIKTAVTKAHGRAVYVPDADEAKVHQLLAASDIVVVPSRHEPCGLVQQYAQRYGAPPVVHATGGLIDTVVDCDSHLETGTGFVFDEDTADALVGAVERAVGAYHTKAWPRLVRRVMRLDRSWDGPARRYDAVYRQVVGG